MAHSLLRSLWESKSSVPLIFDQDFLDSSLRHYTSDETSRILQSISNITHPIVDSSNKPKWDIGWGQNLSFLQDGVAPELALTPCYFGKYPLVRILGSFYSFFDSQELDSLIDSFITPPYDIPQEVRFTSLENVLYREMLSSLVFQPFYRFCANNDLKDVTIVDLGAGTCHNLLHLFEFFKRHLPHINLTLVATDWSSSTQGIVDYLSQNNIVSNVYFSEFNYFDPSTWDSLLQFNPTCLYSIASLEQFPSNTTELLEFLVSSSLRYSIHIEPVKELLSPSLRLDSQSISYMTERNYLNNFSTDLLALEMLSHGTISSSIFRTGLGSLFIDGYSHLSWAKL